MVNRSAKYATINQSLQLLCVNNCAKQSSRWMNKTVFIRGGTIAIYPNRMQYL